ncbi:Putative 4,5-dihydroxyphthalate dehydrogenase [Roseibium album]|nr:Putative 4,5-dihydroxyphthalate dehydrogenase [Roseibium album]
MNGRMGLAIIGLGMASKPHALAIKDMSDRIDVRGVFARSEKSRNEFSNAYGFPVVENIEALVIDPTVDALLLLTPPNARTEIISLFAGSGKHILCEKPLERTVDTATNIVETCENAGVRLGVVFQHRFRAASLKLSELIAAGDLGQIRVVRADIPWWRDQAYYDDPGRGTYERDGGGVLISQAVHTLDFMLSLIPPVTAVQALCATTSFHQMEAEDFCASAFEFEGGVGSIVASTASFPGNGESLSLDCDNASVSLKSGSLTINWRDGRIDQFGEEADTGGGADPMAFPYEWHKSLIGEFTEAVAENRDPLVTGRQALEVHRLIQALELSSKQGQRIALA